MLIENVIGTAVTGIEIRVNIFEANRIATLADELKEHATALEEHKLTNRKEVVMALNKTATLLKKLTKDTPSLQQVEKELFDAGEENEEENSKVEKILIKA